MFANGGIREQARSYDHSNTSSCASGLVPTEDIVGASLLAIFL